MDKETKKTIITLVIPIIVTLLLDLFYVLFNYNILYFMVEIKPLILSLFIVYLLFFIIWAITKKSGIALTIISIFLFLFSIINQIKIGYTGESILLSDILFLNNTEEITGIIGSTVFNVFRHYLKYAIIYLVLNIIICIISIKSTIIIKTKTRISLLVTSVTILVFLFLPFKYITNSMLIIIFDTDKRVDYERLIYQEQNFLKYGIIAGMYNDLLEKRMYEPKGYNEDVVNLEIANAKNQSDNSFGTPNIIVVFAESFWDIDQLDEIKFDKKVTANFEKLKEKGIFINMISPSYGGVSSNIEFEFLTGANLMYFNKGYIPTMQLYKNKTYFNRPSIISELKNNGYKTKIVNYTPGTSFGVEKFYKYIGVDEAEFNLNVEKKYFKGQYVSDEYIIDKTIDEFKNKNKDEKLFYMTLTMQSHMPYLINKYNNYDIDIINSELSQSMNETILSYAQGIYDIDNQLGKLYEYIQSLDEPTMIVFYGDHLPYLKTTENVNILDYLRYFNTGDEKLDYYRKYNTQALILANFEIEDDDTKYLSPDLLGCYIINKMDIDISKYYIWLYNNKYTLASANWYVAMDAQGNLYYTKDLNDELKSIYDCRKKVQYKFFVK